MTNTLKMNHVISIISMCGQYSRRLFRLVETLAFVRAAHQRCFSVIITAVGFTAKDYHTAPDTDCSSLKQYVGLLGIDHISQSFLFICELTTC